MKITQEERTQFRQLIQDVAFITDPGLVSTSSTVMVPKSTVERMERAYMALGRMGFYEKLKKLMDDVTEAK